MAGAEAVFGTVDVLSPPDSKEETTSKSGSSEKKLADESTTYLHNHQ